MLRDRGDVQAKYEFVRIEDLVPQNHLLRKIQAIFDSDFIRERAAAYYAKRGRPAIDPVVLVKMELIAYLYGIRSDRRLVEEIRVNLAYRWFLGLGLTDPVPHFTTPGKNYSRRWKDSGFFEELFDHVVKRAIDAGCQFAGASVHLVTAELDAGPIVQQGIVPVLPGDTAETLAARVLVQEHQIYPQAVRKLLAR